MKLVFMMMAILGFGSAAQARPNYSGSYICGDASKAHVKYTLTDNAAQSTLVAEYHNQEGQLYRRVEAYVVVREEYNSDGLLNVNFAWSRPSHGQLLEFSQDGRLNVDSQGNSKCSALAM